MRIDEFFDREYGRFERYWWKEEERWSPRPEDHVRSVFTRLWLGVVHQQSRRAAALDLGAGEGADSIRLARMGYGHVRAVELSNVAVEKIRSSASVAGVDLDVVHADARHLELDRQYDVVVMNGLLHYVEDKRALLDRLIRHTAPGGVHVVSAFSTYSPVPSPHLVVPVWPDDEGGAIEQAYDGWSIVLRWYDRCKPEGSHPGLGAHVHSFVKLIAIAPDVDAPAPVPPQASQRTGG